MSFSPLAFAFQIANFAILVWLLKRFLYAPLLAAIDARRDELAQAQAAARAAKSAADAAADAARAQARETEMARAKLIENARADALAERQRIVDGAHREAQGRLEAAAARLAGERRAAANALRADAAALAEALARRVMAGLPDAALDAGFRDAVGKWLDALPRDKAADLLTGAAPVRIATAAALDAPSRAAWIDLFGSHASSAAMPPAFVVDPAIGGGVEIDFPGGSARFSLRAAAAELRANAAADD